MKKFFPGFALFLFLPLPVIAASSFAAKINLSHTNLQGRIESNTAANEPKKLAQSTSSEWTLVFQDEFDGSSLDTSKWRAYGPWPQSGDTQNYMMQDEVSVSGGILQLRAQKRDVGGRPYTSGGVDTHFTFNQVYGKWEVRARVPSGVGLLPYAALFPADESWPPEIDVVEVLGRKTNEVVMTNHWSSGFQHYFKANHYQGPDFSQDFHTFTVEWYPDKIRWLVDGVERHVSTEGLHGMPSKFTMALGVGNCGSWPDCPNDSVVFPKSFEIDYVRIYKLN